ncbi:hypothetical protein [Viridibacillus arvi]|uniref:hypothetical protein n=1 Tax=Viridibacillus arvi TaxID=263475 RepID=UPI0034CE20FE
MGKERSDKRRDIKPSLPLNLKEAIYRLSFITKIPVKDIAEDLVLYGIKTHDVIGKIAKKFRRDVRIDSTLYRGNLSNLPVSKEKRNEELDRITTRLTGSTFEIISALSYALDCRPARTCSLLIEESFHDVHFLHNYCEKHLNESIDKQRMLELKKILNYINNEMPNNEKFTWAGLLFYIYNEVSIPASTTKEVVNDFIVNHWRNP